MDQLEELSSIKPVNPFVLGILGSTESFDRETILDAVLYPVLQELSRMPSRVIMPAEGKSSILISAWANRLSVPTLEYQCDWKTLGKRARALRDARILREATHLILFCSAKSDYYIKTAQREAKKGRTVFTVDGKTAEIQQWIL